MFIPPRNADSGATDPATTMFKFWISFWPVAPLFGVKWRFGDVSLPVHGNLAARPADLARAGAEVQERAVEEVASAPAVAEPVAETAARKAAKAEDRIEREIEATLEPKIDAEAAATAEAEASPEPESAGQQRHLELEGDERPSRKPKGLRSKPPAEPDDLKVIKGVGPSLERQLNDLGIYTLEQIARLDDEELAWVDQNLETVTFKGRCYSDDWVGQAKAQLG